MTISVFVPNYNRAQLISGAPRPLVNQTRQADEIIVVDDASTDESMAVIEGFAPHLPHM